MKFSVANLVYELHLAQCPVSPQQIRLRQQLLRKHGKTNTKLFFSCPVSSLPYVRLPLRFNFSILFQIFCVGLQFLISSFGEIHLIELCSGLLICSCSENCLKKFLTRHSSVPPPPHPCKKHIFKRNAKLSLTSCSISLTSC